MWLAHLGDFGQKNLENGQIEKLKQVDILMIPVGGTFTIDAKQASNIISQIEPRIIIPMHYKINGLELNIDEVEKFIKEQGITPVEAGNKLKINKKDLPAEDTKLFVMNAKN